MAEIKNTFLRSKMNKDLDNRLIPNGEYRDAENISVGKSEANNIGSLENVLGNALLSNGTAVTAGNIIGTYNDEPNELIYAFFTDNISVENLISTSVNHYIVVIKADGSNFNSGNPWNILVEGKFLNFSTSFPVVGINLIEDLLFFTDNRNQPRVINVTNSLGYYTQESDISVAKFSPFEPIQLIKHVQTTSTTTQTSSVVAVANATGIEIGMTLISTNSAGDAIIEANQYVFVTAINSLLITLSSQKAFTTGDLLYFAITTMTNEKSNANWPGDPNFLLDKFVRFSYRYRYSDGEYSTFAPFTQPAYIPSQKGYFLNENEENAYRSTIINWMENSVQNIELLIPLPDVGSKIGGENDKTYKIIEIDILYKESDALVAKVLETINSTRILTSSTNVFSFNYQSSKPYKTLTEAQTIRVYDQIPVRALAQESAGNRIIYGNFYNKYSPPTNGITYEVGVGRKRTTPNVNNWIEYPNSSLKQNRNYQVGIILADKWGRQSSVILSNAIAGTRVLNNIKFGASTVYAPYNDASESSVSPIKDWFGDALNVFFPDAIATGDSSGTYISAPTRLPNVTPWEIGSDPGLYAQSKGGNTGFDISGTTPIINTPTTIPVLNVPGFKYEFTPTSIGGTVIANWGTRGGVSSTCQTTCSIDMAATLAITNGGTGYTVGDNLATTTLTGTGSNMKINILSVGFGGVITSAVVGGFSGSGGVNYFENDTIQPIQGTNTTSTITITANTGTLANIQVGDVITTSIAANSHLNGAVVTAILGSNSAGGLSPFAAWAVQINKPTAPGYAGPQGGSTTTYPLTFSRGGSVPVGIPIVGDYLRGEYVDYVEIEKITITGSAYTVYTKDEINKSLYSLSVPAVAPDIKFAYSLNQAGWYSYKIVVKQQEQDYYNAFIPGILNGYPKQKSGATPFPLDEINETANIVLLNDNINKIPRDLGEVGPDQKQFSSSVQLFGRVENTATSNVQFFPGNLSDTVVNIETANDSGMEGEEDLDAIGIGNLYQLNTNPLIGRVSTSKKIGVSTNTMVPHLAIYETEPVESILDIYWESTTTGLISDLNADILSGFTGAAGFSDFNFLLTEATPLDTLLCSNDFKPVDTAGVEVDKIINTFTVRDGNEADVTTQFELVRPDGASYVTDGVIGGTYTGPWNIRPSASNSFTFDYNRSINNFTPTEYFEFNFNFEGTVQSFKGDLGNIAPTISPSQLQDLQVGQGDAGELRNMMTNAENGSIAASSKQNSLAFNIDSQKDGNGTILNPPYFSLTPQGSLTMDAAITVPGSYDLVIKLKDAVLINADNTVIEGTKFESVQGTLTVIVGNAPLTPGCISPCVDPSNPGFFPINTVQAVSPNIKYNACWYISDETLTNSDFAGTGLTDTADASGTVNTVLGVGGAGANNAPTHLGQRPNAFSDQKIGTIVFNISLSQTKTQAGGVGSFINSAVDSFNVYSREAVDPGSTPNQWLPAVDLNGYEFENSTAASTLQLGMSTSNSVLNTFKYQQYIFAFPTPVTGGFNVATEYAIVMIGLDVNNPDYVPATAEMPFVSVNSQDLYNDVCVLVPKSGTNAAINYGTLANTTPKSYRYAVGAPSSDLNLTPGGGSSGGSNATNFAGTAYGEYVTRFQNSFTLQNPADWTTVGPGGNAYSTSLPCYPWNVTDVVTSTTPAFTVVGEYDDYNFTAKMLPNPARVGAATENGVPFATAPFVYNYGNSGQTTGVQKPLLRKSGGASG